MEGDVAPLTEIAELCARFGARLMVDEAHALGVLGARGRRDRRADGRRGPGRPADGHVLQVARIVRGRDRRPRGRDRVPADPVAALHVHRIGRAGGGRRSARGRPDLPLRRGAAAIRQGARQRALPPCRAARPRIQGRRTDAAGRREPRSSTPVVPVVVGDDWKAVFLWKALYEAGVSTSTSRSTLRCRPPGPCCGRSVMATHDRATLDRALDIFAATKRAFEAEHGPLPTSTWSLNGDRQPARDGPDRRTRGGSCPLLHKAPGAEKDALSTSSGGCDLAVTSAMTIRSRDSSAANTAEPHGVSKRCRGTVTSMYQRNSRMDTRRKRAWVASRPGATVNASARDGPDAGRENVDDPDHQDDARAATSAGSGAGQ